MAYKNQTGLVIILLALLNSSCSPYSRLYNDFTKGQSSIQYIHTSGKEGKKNEKGIFIDKPFLSDRKFNSSANVHKINSSVVPLLVFNSWKYQYECAIGPPMIKENLPRFIQTSFLEESERSGTFRIDTLSSPASLSLEIDVDSLAAKGPYDNTGYFIYLFFGYSYQVHEHAGPGVAYSRFHYRVRKGDAVVLEDVVSHQASFQPLKMARTTFKKFHDMYRANLVESLGDTFKRNIEEIVSHLNILLEKDPDSKSGGNNQ
ncbi:MAG TPA: hypothetical protein VK517_09025 [Cyclobacteriaceae bacterium]|jgi:hypothetical protein|nr:hypothetical protein [Cyclobacteriaceae bacterium]